jgi:Zn-dependent protease with chaperone function
MKHTLLCLSLVLVALLPVSLAAQPSTIAQKPDTAQTASANVVHDNSIRVPVPAMSAKAVDYYNSGNVLWFIDLLWGLAIPLIFLFTGFSARIRNWAQRISSRWFLVIALYFVFFSLITFVIDFPLSYYTSYVRPHSYDLSNQTFGKWFGDELKSLLIGTLAGVLLLWLPLRGIKRWPRYWWLIVGVASLPFMIFAILIQPVFIDPLFNDFGPMKNKELEAKILALADRAGIEGSRVYEVNKSADTKTVNAYVTGFGSTKRIVLWDTIIQKLDEEELLFVMGHEMGHYVLNHIFVYLLIFPLFITLGLFLIHRTSGYIIRRWEHRLGFNALHDVAALPLLIVMFGLFNFIIAPAQRAITRNSEHEADRFALEITHSNHAGATAFTKLQAENLGNPRPGLLYKLWRSTHPPIGERIDFCNEYRPWEAGAPRQYEHLFKTTPAQK